MHKRYGPLALGLRAGREGVRRVTNTAGVPTGYVLRGTTIGWQHRVRQTEALIILGLILQNRTSASINKQIFLQDISVQHNTQIQYNYCIDNYCIVLWPTNVQLSHMLSHSYMFRHYCVILSELVINTLPSYTSISNAAVGNTIYNFTWVLCCWNFNV